MLERFRHKLKLVMRVIVKSLGYPTPRRATLTMIALIAAPAFLHPRAPTAHAPRCSRLVACSEAPETTELKAAERSMDVGGYEAPLDKVTWKPFTYALPRARREAVRAYASNAARTLPPLPPLKIALIGPASSGTSASATSTLTACAG